MEKMRKIILTAAAIAFAAGLGIAGDSVAAEVRFEATVRTPNVSFHVGNTPVYRAEYRRAPLSARRGHRYVLVARDRIIARRLARYTGVPVGDLLRLRRYGYTWFEIGRWLGVGPRVVRAAMHKKTWNRFMLNQRRMVKIAVRPGRRGR